MSFVVMGMDAPENCLKCPMNCKAPDGRILCRRDFQERNPRMRDRCDILPLPEKHGRLGDLDELQTSFSMLVENYERFSYELGNKRNYEVMNMADSAVRAFRSAERMTKELETIVEAEGRRI